MSVRLELSAFDLAKLRSLLGSGSHEVVEELSSALEQAAQKPKSWASDLREKGRAEYLESLSAAVLQGAPFSGLTTERPHHQLLASHLARYGQRHRRIDCGIPREIIQDFLQEQGRLVGTEGRRLLRFLVKGRPLFGQRGGAGKAYGFLSHDETTTLRRSLERYSQNSKADEDGTEFAEEMMECLDGGLAHPRQPDLWALIG